jgi:hypothetical protein
VEKRKSPRTAGSATFITVASKAISSCAVDTAASMIHSRWRAARARAVVRSAVITCVGAW